MHFLDDASHIAEDDRLRSSYMRELVRATAPIDAPSDPVNIPKVILQFWHDLGTIPADVCECLDSWEPLTRQGFKRVLFDDNEARRFIAREFGSPHVAALTNIEGLRPRWVCQSLPFSLSRIRALRVAASGILSSASATPRKMSGCANQTTATATATRTAPLRTRVT